MSASPLWFKFWPDRWCGSRTVRWMTWEERGVYVQLLIECATGPVPDDPKAIARANSVPEELMLRVWDKARPHMIETDEGLSFELIEESRSQYERQSRRGKKAASARHSAQAHAQAGAQAHAQATAQAGAQGHASQEPIANSQEKEPEPMQDFSPAEKKSPVADAPGGHLDRGKSKAQIAWDVRYAQAAPGQRMRWSKADAVRLNKLAKDEGLEELRLRLDRYFRHGGDQFHPLKIRSFEAAWNSLAVDAPSRSGAPEKQARAIEPETSDPSRSRGDGSFDAWTTAMTRLHGPRWVADEVARARKAGERPWAEAHSTPPTQAAQNGAC